MPRPFKERNVNRPPGACIYKPAGVPAHTLSWVNLTLDEYEAIRLIDHEGLEQQTVAEQMGVSRPTVTRIYGSARKKLAQAIVLGMAIRIEGGPVVQRPADFCPGRGRGMGQGRGRGCGRGGRGRGRGQNINLQEQNDENSDPTSE